MGAAASAITVKAVPGIPWSVASYDGDLRIRLMHYAPNVMATLIHELRAVLSNFRTIEWTNDDTLEILLHEALDGLDNVQMSMALTRALAHSSYFARLSLRISGSDCCVFIGGAKEEEPLSSFAVLPLGDSRLRLSYATPSSHSLLDRCIQRTYPAGLHSARSVDEHTDEYVLVGMPWTSTGELRIDADSLMLEFAQLLARNGWRLHARFGKLIIYSFAEATIASKFRPELTVNLMSHNMISFTGLPRDHQKEIDAVLGSDATLKSEEKWLGRTYRTRVEGSPWWSQSSSTDRNAVVDLLCRLLSALLRLEWMPCPIGLSPSGLMFTNTIDTVPRTKKRVMCSAAVWIKNSDEVNLTNFPSTVNDLLISTATRHFGIVKSERPSVNHYRIRSRLVVTSTIRMHALLTVFLNELSLIGWRALTSLQLFEDTVNVIFVLPDEAIVRERSEEEKQRQCKNNKKWDH